MPEADLSPHPELEMLDLLISQLEAVIAESDETPLMIEANDPPKRAVYRILGNAVGGKKQQQTCEAVFLDNARLVLRCNKTEIVRLTPLEVTVNAEKSGRGEAFCIVTGKASGTKRIRGGYEVDIDISEKRKVRISPGQRLRECLSKSDATGWNRWCLDIRDGLELMGMDLKRADLQGYDLCCADLTGSDLTGANLSGAILAGALLGDCKLDDAVVTGADFFRAKMSRNQAGLLAFSGMPEIESVVFEA